MLLFVLNTHKERKKSDVGMGGKEHLGICRCSRRGVGSLICHSGPWRGICAVGGGGDLFWEGWLKAPGRQWLLRGGVWPHGTKVRCLEDKLLEHNGSGEIKGFGSVGGQVGAVVGSKQLSAHRGAGAYRQH